MTADIEMEELKSDMEQILSGEREEESATDDDSGIEDDAGEEESEGVLDADDQDSGEEEYLEPDDGEEEDEDSGEEQKDADAPAFDISLIMRAAKLGLSDQEVAQFSSPQELERGIALLERRQKNDATAEDGQEESEDEFKPFEVGDLEAFDDELSGPIKGMAEFVNKMGQQMQQLQKMVGGMNAQTEQQSKVAIIEQFDNTLNKSGLTEILGDTPPAEGTKEYNNRVEVFKEFNVLREADRMAGRNTPAQDLIGRAVKNLYAEQLESKSAEKVKSEAVKRMKKRGRLKQPKPHDTGQENPDPEEKALSAIKEKLAMMND